MARGVHVYIVVVGPAVSEAPLREVEIAVVGTGESEAKGRPAAKGEISPVIQVSAARHINGLVGHRRGCLGKLQTYGIGDWD